jgi:hypothetical protein
VGHRVPRLKLGNRRARFVLGDELSPSELGHAGSLKLDALPLRELVQSPVGDAEREGDRPGALADAGTTNDVPDLFRVQSLCKWVRTWRKSLAQTPRPSLRKC